MMQPDAILFLVSQPYVKGKRFKTLQAGLTRACSIPCAVVRMEGREAGPMSALDALVGEGARDILVQPVGIPFSDSLFAWLPGALSHWQRQSGNAETRLRLATDQIADQSVLQAIATSALAEAHAATPIDPQSGSIDGAGWDAVPPFKHHLLVCTGPRCNFRESGPLKTALAEELSRTGITRQCLIATTGCLFPCNSGPVIAHYPSGRWYRLRDSAEISRFVSTVLIGGQALPDLLIHEAQK